MAPFEPLSVLAATASITIRHTIKTLHPFHTFIFVSAFPSIAEERIGPAL
jgi:hypothetical protein